MSAPAFDQHVSSDSRALLVLLKGSFEVDFWENMRELIAGFESVQNDIELDFSQITRFDTFGAWQINRLLNRLNRQGKNVQLINLRAADLNLLEDIKKIRLPERVHKDIDSKPPFSPITALGDRTLFYLSQTGRMLSFLGEIIIGLKNCIVNSKDFRTNTFYDYIDQVGFKSLPIIGMIAFLIGVVLVYQGVSQLERFGAQVFTVNLLAVSVLRELGILLTAIVIAGRSGSAFTAQIGFMKLNQEIDAMEVMGLSPMQILIIPRILALMVCVPLLTIFCNLVALSGGAIMSANLINLSYDQYLIQLQSGISKWTFWTGFIKAPVFAFIIGFVSCYEGMRVRGGAEDVGRRTTQSVVKSIFLVLVLDAVFSVLYSYLEI